MKKCCTCRKVLPSEAFGRCRTYKDNLSYRCKECANRHGRAQHARRMKEDPTYRDMKRNSYIKEAWGITAIEYEAKLAQQDHKSAICEVELLQRGHLTHLDHDHKTGRLRAFLCTNCNRGLGYFKDSASLLGKAAEYLNAKGGNINDSSH